MGRGVLSGPLTSQGGQAYLMVRVTPKTSRNEITGLYHAADGRVSLAIKVTAAPDKGQANRAVINVLAKTLKLPKSSFHLARGETDRNKLFQLNEHSATVASYLDQLQAQQGDDDGKSD